MAQKEDFIQKSILQAAMQLFHRHGLSKITMDDIAKAIGKSRSSLYYYYKNREEIFDAVMNECLEEISSTIALATESATGLENKIKAFFQEKITTSIDKSSFYRALEYGMGADEISIHRATMATFHFELMKREAGILMSCFEESIRNGELKPASKKIIEEHVYIALSSIRGIKREIDYGNKNYIDPTSLIKTLSQIIIKNLQQS